MIPSYSINFISRRVNISIAIIMKKKCKGDIKRERERKKERRKERKKQERKKERRKKESEKIERERESFVESNQYIFITDY